MKKFRFYWHTAGGHVHIRVFVGVEGKTFGKCGDLCMTVDEFETFRALRLPLVGIVEFKEEAGDTKVANL